MFFLLAQIASSLQRCIFHDIVPLVVRKTQGESAKDPKSHASRLGSDSPKMDILTKMIIRFPVAGKGERG